MDDDIETGVKMKARSTGGKGRGRGCGHGKTARISLPRPGKSKQDVTDSKKEDKGVRENEKKEKDDKEDKPKGCRRTRSTETDSDREARLNLAKQCKEKADILKGNVPQAQDDSTSCNSEDITTKINDIEREDFKVIAVDVRKWVREQLEKENMLMGISNAELRSRIHDRLEYITWYSDIHKEHIDKVIFVSDAEQNSTTDEDQSVGGAESEEYGIKGNINSKAEKEQRDSDDSEDWDEEKDIMAFIDEDDLDFWKI